MRLFGDYDLVDPPFDITYGYSKDKWPDLKQFLVSMLCVDRNIPVLGTTTTSNASDKILNNELLTNISKYVDHNHSGSAGVSKSLADETGCFVLLTNLLDQQTDHLNVRLIIPPYIVTAKYMPHKSYLMRGSHNAIIYTVLITCVSSLMSSG